MASDYEKNAKEAFMDDNFEVAVGLYSQAIANLFVERAQAHIKLANFTEAVADTDKAIELDPSLAKAYLRKGTACMKLHEYRTAKATLEAGVALAPGDARFTRLIKESEQHIAASVCIKETAALPKLPVQNGPSAAGPSDLFDCMTTSYPAAASGLYEFHASPTASALSGPLSRKRPRSTDWDELEVQINNEALEDQSAVQIVNGVEGNTSAFGTGKRKPVVRGKSFSTSEDELICEYWLILKAKQDPNTGNLQGEKGFYNQLRNLFNEHMEQPNHRTSSGIQHRWWTINRAVRKYCHCISEIESRNQCGVTIEEKYDEARKMYSQSEPKKRAFSFEHCWRILHVASTWLEYNESHSGLLAPFSDVDPEGSKSKEIQANGSGKKQKICRKPDIRDAEFDAKCSLLMEGNNFGKDVGEHSKEDSSINGMEEEQKEIDEQGEAIGQTQAGNLFIKQLSEMPKDVRRATLLSLVRGDDCILALPVQTENID